MSTPPTIIIYAMPGSQFTAKVLAALQHRKIPHYIAFVPLQVEDRRQFLPSGGTLVPEMAIYKNNNDDDDPIVVVPDSEAILEWLDENYSIVGLSESPQFYPQQQQQQPDCRQVSKRASNETLAGLVWYYNWVNDRGFANSMLKSIRKLSLPSALACLVPDFVLRRALESTRTKFRGEAARAIGVTEAQLEDEEAMKQLLVEELMYFQSLLGNDDDDDDDTTQQPYLMANTTQPTAADFSVYAQLERLVGQGTASDVEIFPAIQWFRDEQNETLERLWHWYDHLRATCPVQFKGKRPPPEFTAQK